MAPRQTYKTIAQVIRAPLFAGDKNPKHANAGIENKYIYIYIYIYIYVCVYFVLFIIQQNTNLLYSTRVFQKTFTKRYKRHVKHLDTRSE